MNEILDLLKKGIKIEQQKKQMLIKKVQDYMLFYK